jgi:hypothetical protein
MDRELRYFETPEPEVEEEVPSEEYEPAYP